MARIVVLTEDGTTGAAVDEGLRAAGHAPAIAEGASAALTLILAGSADAMVLELSAGGAETVELIRRLRRAGHRTPVVLLAPPDRPGDIAGALDAGADDYVFHPPGVVELIGRLRVRLREDGGPGRTLLRAGDAVLDLRAHRVLVAGRWVPLTVRECALAEALFTDPGHTLSRRELLSRVWGLEHDPRSNVVDVYVRYLRRKVGPELIEGVRGVGYRLAIAEPCAAP